VVREKIGDFAPVCKIGDFVPVCKIGDFAPVCKIGDPQISNDLKYTAKIFSGLKLYESLLKIYFCFSLCPQWPT